MKRAFIRRNEITHVDRCCLASIASHHSIPFTGTKLDFKDIRLDIFSKNGNKSREIVCYPIEIENVSSIFYWLHSNRKIKNKEKVFVDGKQVQVVPIARIKCSGQLIYNIKQTE